MIRDNGLLFWATLLTNKTYQPAVEIGSKA